MKGHRLVASDYIGNRFGILTVLSQADHFGPRGETLCVCQCDCGNKLDVILSQLISGLKKSCGQCGYRLRRLAANVYPDLTGQIFGRLRVITRARCANGKAGWLCECTNDGNRIVTTTNMLRAGITRSCGCLHTEMSMFNNRKYRIEDEPLRNLLSAMKSRCKSKDPRTARVYGKVDVCDEWKESTMPFINWARANGYREGLVIDRIDGTKGYSPDNCRFVTYQVNANNKVNNRNISVNGVTHSLADWCRITGFTYSSMRRHSDGEIADRIRERLKTQAVERGDDPYDPSLEDIPDNSCDFMDDDTQGAQS